MDIIRKQVGSTKKLVKKQGSKRRSMVNIPKFGYFSKKTKKRVTEKRLVERFNSLRIPPGYKKVEISRYPRSKVQAMGEDDKGRKQYIYSASHVKRQTDVKFHELITFGKNVERIRSKILKNINMASRNKSLIFNKNTLISLVIYLIDNCNFRVGCDKYKKLYNSYGVTTLNKSHIKMDNGKMVIEFIGKKGVQNKSGIKDSKICGLLNQLCKKNNKEYLFETDSVEKIRITERHINGFLKEFDSKIKVKMFRTWNANSILLKEMLAYPIPIDKSEADKNIKSIIESAAEKLHHTKSVSKSSYMNNKLLDLYTNELDTFKNVCKKLKKRNRGKLPNLNKLLIELFIYLDKK
jgi:DNA topoisomerase I